jgi:O-antigen ligase
VWQVAARHGIADAAGRVAIEASTPVYALAMPLAALLAFAAGYLFADRRSWCLTLIRALVVSGFLYALLGILVGISNPGHVLFERKIAYQTDFTGTFINRNTAAAYFGVCLLAALTLAFRAWRENWPSGYLPPRERFLFLTQNFSSASAFWTIATAALLVAVLLTGSRAGMATSLGAASVLFVLLIRKRGRIRRGAVLLGMIVVVGFIVQLFGSGNILTRVTEGFDENGRYAAWSSSWDIVKAFPVFGTGLGTFMAAFPAYRKGEHGIMQIWERAHSTPLEFAAELGLPATILMCALWVLACVMLFRAYRNEPNAYALPALAFAVLLLTGLHSLVDFPLQIPGCAIPVGIVSGALFRQSVNKSASA